jgi:hypothetical protein
LNEDEKNQKLSGFQNENNKQTIINGNLANKPLAIDSKFQGTWAGQIKLDNQDLASDLKLEIIDSEVKLYVKYNSDSWSKINQKACYYDFLGNNFVFAYVDNGNNISYSNAYSFSLVNEGNVNVVFSRNLNENIANSDNKVWRLFGEGQLVKQ